jgi:hypothetical protein
MRVELKINNCCSNDPCYFCGKRTDPTGGLDWFAAGTYALVCEECFNKSERTQTPEELRAIQRESEAIDAKIEQLSEEETAEPKCAGGSECPHFPSPCDCARFDAAYLEQERECYAVRSALDEAERHSDLSTEERRAFVKQARIDYRTARTGNYE